MAEIPLILKIKKEQHKKIARAQDLVVETVYEVFNDAILHGGTAIWRCYQGNRFSEDVDVCISRNLNKISLLFSKFEQKGFIIIKKKISENSIYSSLRLDDTIVRFEAIFRKFASILKEYETIDSNYLTVFTLTPKQFLDEKIKTYLNRLKIRDLYDIFFLLRYIEDKKEIKPQLKKLTANFKKPIDEKELKVLILTGLIPDTEQMLEYIKKLS